MTDAVATLADAALSRAAQRPERAESPLIRKLFLLMHGSYGSLFMAKFATGEKDAGGKDKGIRAAMMVWAAKLDKFPAGVVETAAGRLSETYAEYPPNLPQFELLCAAATPRQTYAEENNLARLPAPVAAAPVEVSFELRSDGKDWARRLLARHGAGEALRPAQLRFAREAMGMPVKVARGAAA